MSREIRILPDAAAIAGAAAEEYVSAAREAVLATGRFAVALSGGSTPRVLYSLLAAEGALRAAIPWDKTYFFFGDERHVPPDSPESNFRMANETLLSRVPLRKEQVSRVRGEMPDAAEAAVDYEKTLRGFFGISDAELPRFDLILLGMGPDGHTASLFPGTAALHVKNRLVVSNWIQELNTERITLTAPVLNNAARILFMVLGEDKAAALGAVLGGSSDPEKFPAQLIQPKSGKVLWLVDKTAARLLSKAAT